MARLTVTINASGEPNDQDLVTLEVPLSMTVADFKQLLESETRFSVATQNLFFEGQTLSDDASSLESLKVKDGDMLALMINVQRQRTRPRPQEQSDANSPARIEEVRQRVLQDPGQMSALIQQVPNLAATINNPDQFRAEWQRMAQAKEREIREREARIRMLNEDPFNAESQNTIAEQIRRENIEANLQYAYEHNPAVFVQVTMLYIPVLVNGQPVKAFVDSGAQSTIMSPSCAEACGISHLIDDRYSGMARGVGTAKIIGKVHQAKIQVGDAELDCAFTVMEGKDVDLLFGLDMLKRHQACIDLLNNKLRFGHNEVAFLGESEIPRREEEKMKAEPTVQGPDGTEIGTRTGTIRPAGSAQAAHDALQSSKAGKAPSASASSGAAAAAATGASSASASASISKSTQATMKPAAAAPAANTSRTAASSASASQARQFPEESISQLVSLGFSREEAIRALEATEGNVEYAAGLLFQ